MNIDSVQHTTDAVEVDPAQVLDSVVSEYEYLLAEVPTDSSANLTELHGALLAYNLGGTIERLPAVPFGLTTRNWRARRVVRSARRIIDRAGGDQAQAMDLAADVVERLIYLIDPELAARAA